MPNPRSDARSLIAVRVVVVTTLLIAALLIQWTVNIPLPIDYLYLTAAVTYAMTLVYIAMRKWISSRKAILTIQLTGDLIIETILVYFTGGIDSPFTFLYLVTIITGSMLLYRRGGLIAASGASILYGALVDSMYYRIIPLPQVTFFSDGPMITPFRLYLNIATNFAAFYATALLTSFISERLRNAFLELDVNRQNLAAMQALHQKIVESIPSGLITLTMQGVITFINPAGAEILGVAASTLIGKRLSHVGLLADDWPGILADVKANGMARGETIFGSGEDSRVLGYAFTPLALVRRDPSGLTLIFQDLTEMKQLESQLRLKDRMAAVGELSAGIAHEIRNPLAAIAGSVQVLKQSTNLSAQEQRLMSIVLRESDRLNKSIADFLRFVKPQEKLPAEFDIAASLADTLALLRNSQELKPGHLISSEIDPPSFSVFGDPDQIRQVFWNLARNAIQAMPDGGELHVSTEIADDEYRIVFSDSGRGISESDQRRLFQPFRTNFPSGTGLGMAISFRIVQEHGGHISVDSLEGKGTAITVALPVPREKGLGLGA